MTEHEFHLARRMFFVKEGTVLIAPKNYPYTHFEWISSLIGSLEANLWIPHLTRGYILNGMLVAYKGTNFDFHINVKDIFLVLDLFPDIKSIGLGVIVPDPKPGPPNAVWEPRFLWSLEKFKRRYGEL